MTTTLLSGRPPAVFDPPGAATQVSPLIALMTDQVEALKQQGVAAARLDSGVSMDDRSAIWRQARAGELDLLYVSPEGLAQPHLIDRLHDLPLSLIAIDEAHCVSQWGHDFRPEYRTLGRLADIFPNVPRLAVTATVEAVPMRLAAAGGDRAAAGECGEGPLADQPLRVVASCDEQR